MRKYMIKQCYFSQNNIKYIDYKDIEILKKFLNPHGRMMSRKKTGVSAKSQRQLAVAVKRARFMGLLPFVAR
jgi:small subunit ribosomal protein S18